MTLAETHLPDFDKGEIAYAMLQFLETYIKDRDHKIKDGFEDGLFTRLSGNPSNTCRWRLFDLL